MGRRLTHRLRPQHYQESAFEVRLEPPSSYSHYQPPQRIGPTAVPPCPSCNRWFARPLPSRRRLEQPSRLGYFILSPPGLIEINSPCPAAPKHAPVTTEQRTHFDPLRSRVRCDSADCRLGGARGGPALIEALIDRQITSLPVPANRPSFSSQARLVSVPALTTLFQLESLLRAVSSSLSRQVTASRGLLGFRHTPECAHYLKRAS